MYQKSATLAPQKLRAFAEQCNIATVVHLDSSFDIYCRMSCFVALSTHLAISRGCEGYLCIDDEQKFSRMLRAVGLDSTIKTSRLEYEYWLWSGTPGAALVLVILKCDGAELAWSKHSTSERDAESGIYASYPCRFADTVGYSRCTREQAETILGYHLPGLPPPPPPPHRHLCFGCGAILEEDVTECPAEADHDYAFCDPCIASGRADDLRDPDCPSCLTPASESR